MDHLSRDPAEHGASLGRSIPGKNTDSHRQDLRGDPLVGRGQEGI
jgi:hypothetical protein